MTTTTTLSPIDAAKTFMRAGSPSDVQRATSILQDAAREGLAEADSLLAALAGAGIGQPQSWRVAVDHLRLAAAAGLDAAQAQLDVLREEGADDPGAAWSLPCEKRTLNLSPKIVAIDRFIGRRACDWIIKRSAAHITPSKVLTAYGPEKVEARDGGSFEMFFTDCDVIVLLLRMRIAMTIGVPVGALENAQVLHYAVGEQFTPHHDYLDPADPNVAAAGQRLATFLVYLNDGYEGGQTEFPRLDILHRGVTGGALYFANLLPTGGPDPRTLHAGLPPRSGEKWLFSQWVRDRARI